MPLTLLKTFGINGKRLWIWRRKKPSLVILVQPHLVQAWQKKPLLARRPQCYVPRLPANERRRCCSGRSGRGNELKLLNDA